MADELQPAAEASDQIEPVFRNGTITAFGITVSFTLGFMAQWASSPGVWRVYDLGPLAAIFLGAVLQVWALALLLPVSSLARRTYDRATRIYLVGFILTGCGVLSAVLFDVVSALWR